MPVKNEVSKDERRNQEKADRRDAESIDRRNKRGIDRRIGWRVDRRTDKHHDRREEVYLYNPIFGDACCDELKEIDKHEILSKICEILGPNPSNFGISEEIFNKLKFEISKYVLHHEYCKENVVRSKLLLWLDGKTSPDNAEKFTDFIDKYLK